MDKLRDNSRLIVAGLITAGIIALLISNSGSNSTNDGQTTATDTTQSQTQDSDVAEDDQDVVIDDSATDDTENVDQTNTDDVQIGRTPSSGPVAVDTVDEGFQATVRKNDNQTVIVRQVINDYLAASSLSLSAEKRLYVETVLVDSLPRKDVIHVGDIISISKNQLDEAIDASNKLSDVELNRWSRYL